MFSYPYLTRRGGRRAAWNLAVGGEVGGAQLKQGPFAESPALVKVRALGRDKGRVDTDRLSPLQLLRLAATYLL